MRPRDPARPKSTMRQRYVSIDVTAELTDLHREDRLYLTLIWETSPQAMADWEFYYLGHLLERLGPMPPQNQGARPCSD